MNRENYLQHPEFNKRFSEAMEGVTFPAESVMVGFDEYLKRALQHISFTTLRMPLPLYCDLIGLPSYKFSFGILQKATDIIYNSTPEHLGVGLPEYSVIIEETAKMIDLMRDITQPITNKVTSALMAKDSVKI